MKTTNQKHTTYIRITNYSIGEIVEETITEQSFDCVLKEIARIVEWREYRDQDYEVTINRVQSD